MPTPGDHARIALASVPASGKARSRTSSRSDRQRASASAPSPGHRSRAADVRRSAPGGRSSSCRRGWGSRSGARTSAPFRSPRTRPSWRSARRSPVTPRPPPASPPPHPPRCRGPRRHEASGRSQMKSRYASAPAMIPPPSSMSRSTISNVASTDCAAGARSRRARRAALRASGRSSLPRPYAGHERRVLTRLSARPQLRPRRRLGHLRAARPPSPPARRSGSTRRSGRR